MKATRPARRRPSSTKIHTALCMLVLGIGLAPPVRAASLQPSRAGLLRQVRSAHAHDYTYLANDSQVREFLRQGYLVPITGNRDFTVKGTVYHKAARPEVKLFLERLGAQYRSACGEPLVVTSLVRPRSRQPRNSSNLSVHPTGMAIDLRVPYGSRCRSWLEGTLLSLERAGVLEAARERHPPHYHVVLFPRDYLAYLESSSGIDVLAEQLEQATYEVRRGDSLWKIAQRHGTTVDQIRTANRLPSISIRPGQMLEIPAR